ncbi:MAG: Hpt domain-containing protein [Longimicrobiaceae bacterium]
MSQPLSEYFAQEAGEYLDHLDALLARPEAPDPVEFFRLARGVRGSAQLAGAQGVARVAEGMEDAARALRDGALAWSDDVRTRAQATAADLRVLVASSARWGAEEDRRAREAVARWEGTGAARRRDGAAGGGQIFDFLRREIAGVVGEMDRALAELRESPTGREPLRAVLRRMRPVRGVAGMDNLSPVLELLEGIEDAAHAVMGRTTGVAAAEVELLSAGRDALAAAGAGLERGQAVGETPELQRFRQVRDGMEAEAGDDDVVPVASLFHDDAGPHVVSSPMAPAPAGEGTLVAEVDSFLRMEATGFLDRAEGLIASLSARPTRFARIARELRELARGVGDLAVTYGMTAIARAAEDAAARISGAATPEDARGALVRLRSSLPGAASEPAAVEVQPELASVPAAASEDGVVSVETLVYDPDEALREALRMRERVFALAAGAGDGVREALDELFGLVALGVERRAHAAG